MLYVGFGIGEAMVPEECTSHRIPVTDWVVQEMIATRKWVNICYKIHGAILYALNERYGIDLMSNLATNTPIVPLGPGDELLIIKVRGLPWLDENRRYTPEEVTKSVFKFTLWIVAD